MFRRRRLSDLWTPDGVEYVQSWEVGRTEEDGLKAIKHEFKLSYKGQTEYFGVLASEDASEAQIEDLAAWTAEHSMMKIIDRLERIGSTLVPQDLAKRENWDARRELAAIFRDFKKSQARRRASSNGRLYYTGLVT